MSELIKTKGALDKVTFSIAHEALARKEATLAESAKVVAVSDATSLELASKVAADLAAESNFIERSRKSVKEPLLALGRQIDDLASRHSSEVLVEIKRIKSLICSYQEEEARKIREEQHRLAEEVRKEAEAAKAKLAAAQTAKDQERVRSEAQANIAKIVDSAPTMQQSKGVTTREVTDYEITDIHALFRERPDLCHPPTPRHNAIIQLLDSGIVIPGIRKFRTMKATTRATRP